MKFREVGSVAKAPGRGRKRITNDRDDRMIAKRVKKNRFVTVTEIQANLALRVSQDTIYRRIKETTGFGSYHACRKPFLREAKIIKWRELCLLRANWTVEQWRRVIWSDESPFVIRRQGKDYNPPFHTLKMCGKVTKGMPASLYKAREESYGMGMLCSARGSPLSPNWRHYEPACVPKNHHEPSWAFRSTAVSGWKLSISAR